MACLVCVCFSRPFAASETADEEVNLKRLALGRFSIQADTIKVAETKLVSSNKLTGGRITAHQGCCGHLMAHSRRPCDLVTNFNVVSGVYTVISGFWVGPDIEDGWGYIEASVNRNC